MCIIKHVYAFVPHFIKGIVFIITLLMHFQTEILLYHISSINVL